VLEELLPAEELKNWNIGIRAAAPIALIGEVVHCLEDGQSCHQPRRQERPAGIVVIDCTEPLFQKAPVDRARQLHQRPIHVEHLVEPGPEQVGLAALSALPRSHCPRTPRFVRTMESQGAGRIEFAGIVVHSHEIRQTRILVQIQNSHKISGVRSTDDEEALALQKPVPPMMR
jgi:hypothetical protein